MRIRHNLIIHLQLCHDFLFGLKHVDLLEDHWEIVFNVFDEVDSLKIQTLLMRCRLPFLAQLLGPFLVELLANSGSVTLQLWHCGELLDWDYLSDDRPAPVVDRLLLILNLEVLTHKARHSLKDLDQLVKQLKCLLADFV